MDDLIVSIIGGPDRGEQVQYNLNLNKSQMKAEAIRLNLAAKD